MRSDDISDSIRAKSDQLNAEDLLGGPITVRIRDVNYQKNREQPLWIYYDGDDGKPWKPCKSMMRVLARLWGKHSSEYVGHSMTLYNEPTVKWAGKDVGGVRISHMDGIEREYQIALSEAKGKRKPFTVRPLQGSNVPPPQEDKALIGVSKLIARIKQATDLAALSADQQVMEQRDWLQANRNELAVSVTKAFEERAEQLRSQNAPQDDPPPQQQNENPAPPDDGFPSGDEPAPDYEGI